MQANMRPNDLDTIGPAEKTKTTDSRQSKSQKKIESYNQIILKEDKHLRSTNTKTDHNTGIK